MPVVPHPWALLPLHALLGGDLYDHYRTSHVSSGMQTADKVYFGLVTASGTVVDGVKLYILRSAPSCLLTLRFSFMPVKIDPTSSILPSSMFDPHG